MAAFTQDSAHENEAPWLMQILRAHGLQDERVTELGRRIFETIDHFMAFWVSRSAGGRPMDHPYQLAGRLQTLVHAFCTHFVEEEAYALHEFVTRGELHWRRVEGLLVVPDSWYEWESALLQQRKDQMHEDLVALQERCMALMEMRIGTKPRQTTDEESE
jgi:hypothetical protein